MNHPPNELALVRYLSAAGVGSRRYCDRLIAENRVMVNQKKAEFGTSVRPGRDLILVDGQRIEMVSEPVYIMLHKPKGYLVAEKDSTDRPLARELLPEAGCRLFPTGRLDFQSEGMLIYTNDGLWANKVAHPSNNILKTYHVKVKGVPGRPALKRLRDGIRSEGVLLKARDASVLRKAISNCWLEIVLSGGAYRQIRRMCEEIDHPVIRLIRVAIGPVRLGSLKPGQYRYLNRNEIQSLVTGSGPSERKSEKSRRSR